MRKSYNGIEDTLRFGRVIMEGMMRNFIKNMSKEDKQKMMQEFMNSMSEEEKSEMMKMMMPLMMKNMKPTMMANMMKDCDANDCKEMMAKMPLEMRRKCRKMMTDCLKASEETEQNEK